MKPRILLSVNKGKELYVAAVEACGGEATALYLPPLSTDYDGLILGGGNDVHPSRYGEEVNGSVDFDEARDECEIALAKAFLAAGKPVLGICRGEQLLNVIFGGTLCQHLPCTPEHRTSEEHLHSHGVIAQENSVFHRLYGKNFRVNSLHHQAVERLGEGLRATLIAEENGVIEGFEHETLPVLGVQWHPEKMCLSERREDTADGIEIIRYFIELCKK